MNEAKKFMDEVKGFVDEIKDYSEWVPKVMESDKPVILDCYAEYLIIHSLLLVGVLPAENSILY